MSLCAYLFEAKSIQSYLMLGGKMADMVYASELIEQLTGDLLDETLTSLNLIEGENIEFSRRAGGCFYAFLTIENAQRLQALWPLMVEQVTPGLEYIHCLAEGDNAWAAMQNGTAKLGAMRNSPRATLPLVGALVQRAPRTGKAAVKNDYTPGGGREWIDAALKARRDFRETRFFKGKLSNRLLHDDARQQNCYWPTNLQGEGNAERAFPFVRDDNLLAIVHADGNGIGGLLIALGNAVKNKPEDSVKIYRMFSEGLCRATEDAAKSATRDVLLPAQNSVGVLPARPLILGGDDLTMIVRADLVFEFTRQFVEYFERETRVFLSKLKQQFPFLKDYGLPSMLTACAGIVIQKSSQPFSSGYQLCEQLCKQAKQKSKAVPMSSEHEAPPSSMAFHRLTGSWISSLDDIQASEYQIIETLAVEDPGSAHMQTRIRQLGLGAYGIGKTNQALPKFDDLQELLNEVQACRLLKINGIRQLASEAHLGGDRVEKFVRRLDELDKQSNKLKSVKQAAAKLHGVHASELVDLLFVNATQGQGFQSRELKAPLVDLLSLAKGAQD